MFSQKILLAYDGTDGAEHALEKTKQLVKLDPNLMIHIVFVHELPKIMMGEAYVINRDPDESELDQETLSKVSQAERELSMIAPCTSETVMSDNPEKEILEQADKFNCDLIIIGSRGLGGFKKLFLGSVSNHIVNHATVPVLVIK